MFMKFQRPVPMNCVIVPLSGRLKCNSMHSM